MHKDAIETPTEHGRRVVAKYPIPRDSMDDFVRAYEIASLSAREPTADERSRAVRFSKEIVGRPTGQATRPAEVVGAPPKKGAR
jgi:hypothetical protein